MSTAVVYYSLNGNCALAAKALAEKLGAKLVELKEAKPRELPKGFAKAGFQAFFGIASKLDGQPWHDVAGCGELHIVTPIWAGKPVPAVNRFLRKCGFGGKAVTVYTVQADPEANAEAARRLIAGAVRRKGGTVRAIHGLVGGAPGKPADEGVAGRICSL